MVESFKQVPSQIEPFFFFFLAVLGLSCGTWALPCRIFVGSCGILHHSPQTLRLWCVGLVALWPVGS